MVAASLRKLPLLHEACEDDSKFTGILPPPFLQLDVPLELLGKVRDSHARSDLELLKQILEIARLDKVSLGVDVFDGLKGGLVRHFDVERHAFLEPYLMKKKVDGLTEGEAQGTEHSFHIPLKALFRPCPYHRRFSHI